MQPQKVTLGGQEFTVPPLPIKTLRVVVPNITALTQRADASGIQILEGESFDKLLETVFAGVAAGTPGFTRAQFDELPAQPGELLAALTVISEQTGMTAKAGEVPAGEAQPASPSTSTSSSA